MIVGKARISVTVGRRDIILSCIARVLMRVIVMMRMHRGCGRQFFMAGKMRDPSRARKHQRKQQEGEG